MKNNKRYNYFNLISGNSSKMLLGLLCVSVLALVLYFGISVAGKGTFSAGNTYNYTFLESEGTIGFKCYVAANNIAEVVYVTGIDNDRGGVPTGVFVTNPNRFQMSGGVVVGYDMSGAGIGGIDHTSYFINGELKDPNYWRCALTNEFTNADYGYMCDTDGQLVIAPLCRRYTESSTDGNLQLSSTTNASDVMCGTPGYYLYGLNELSPASTCMSRIGSSFGHQTEGETHVVGVNMCNPVTGIVVNLVSCNNDADPTCYSAAVSERVSNIQSGYLLSTLTDASDPACAAPKKCYKCTQKENSILAESSQPDVTNVNNDGTCPEGYSSDEKYKSCVHECYICSGDIERTISDVYIDKPCEEIFAHTGYSTSRGDDYCANASSSSGNTPSTTDSVICYRCSPTEEEREFTDTTTCPTDGGWIEGRLNCPGGSSSSSGNSSNTTNLKDCYSCYNGDILRDRYTSCPEGWSETIPDCSANENNSNNNNSNNVTTTTKAVDEQGNVTTNEQTGSSALIIAWIIGITAIGYAFYYFRQTNTKEN